MRKLHALVYLFKPDIDDLRESPSLKIVEELCRQGHKILVVEPNIEKLPQSLINEKVTLCSINSAIHEADIVAFLVKHRIFSDIKLESISEKIVLDFCGMGRF